jgi:hypothetical protein
MAVAARAMRRHVELGFERMRHARAGEPEEIRQKPPQRKAAG